MACRRRRTTPRYHPYSPASSASQPSPVCLILGRRGGSSDQDHTQNNTSPRFSTPPPSFPRNYRDSSPIHFSSPPLASSPPLSPFDLSETLEPVESDPWDGMYEFIVNQQKINQEMSRMLDEVIIFIFVFFFVCLFSFCLFVFVIVVFFVCFFCFCF